MSVGQTTHMLHLFIYIYIYYTVKIHTHRKYVREMKRWFSHVRLFLVMSRVHSHCIFFCVACLFVIFSYLRVRDFTAWRRRWLALHAGLRFLSSLLNFLHNTIFGLYECSSSIKSIALGQRGVCVCIFERPSTIILVFRRQASRTAHIIVLETDGDDADACATCARFFFWRLWYGGLLLTSDSYQNNMGNLCVCVRACSRQYKYIYEIYNQHVI